MNIKSWKELTDFHTPDWFRRAKFGIYTHWGPYAVPACGPNVSWYPHRMYQEGSAQYEYHCKHFGHPSQFGYKDFIPLFTGEKFDAEEWAELFQKSGARFAGPVAEHHDGFSMWNSRVNEWNAYRMGPKRDVVGELEKAIRNKDMHFMVALHHAESWKFYPHWVKEYDTSDPKYAGLYGEPHNMDWGSEKRFVPEDLSVDEAQAGGIDKQWQAQDPPSEAFLDKWFEKCREVIDGYSPDYIWFDFGLDFIKDSYQRKFLSYYYDDAKAKGKEVVVSYKWDHLPAGSGMIDVEQGRFNDLTYHDWITDTTVDDGEAWGYMHDAGYKTSSSLIHYLVDNVSKNGYLLLNVGPKANGEIPEEAKQILLDIGDWLGINGEAVFDTTPWRIAAEGPTRMVSAGPFSEMDDLEYTAQDIRFTMNGNCIYATTLGVPEEEVVLHTLLKKVYPEEIEEIVLLGDGKPLPWRIENKKVFVDVSGAKKCKHANVLKIIRKD